MIAVAVLEQGDFRVCCRTACHSGYSVRGLLAAMATSSMILEKAFNDEVHEEHKEKQQGKA